MSNIDQTQPTYLSILRGGRLAKIGNRAASYAPVLGLVGAAALFGASAAQADNECGAENLADPTDTITCGPGNYAGGIGYSDSDGLTLELNGDPLTVTSRVSIKSSLTSTGDISIIGTNFSSIQSNGEYREGLLVGIYGASDSSGKVVLTSGSITTNGGFSSGLLVFSESAGTGDGLVQMDGGSITTNGSPGLFTLLQHAQSSGNATAVLTAGSINTSGQGAHGLQARADGSGDSIARMQGGSVTTNSESFNVGVYAIKQGGEGSLDLTTGNSGAAIAVLTGGEIQILGGSGWGMAAESGSGGDLNGNTIARMEGGSILTTGTSSLGVLSYSGGSSPDVEVTAVVTGGRIETGGDNSQGVAAVGQLSGGGRAYLEVSGDAVVITSGLNSHGAAVELTELGSTYEVVVGGTANVTSGQGRAAGIHTVGVGGGTISVSAGAVINSAASGIAIRDGDGSFFGTDTLDGIDTTGGNVVVTTAGTVTGNAILGLGDDTFNLTGGVYTGDIYGDDVVASANDGKDAFNWSGGRFGSTFFGGNGSDAANITAATYDGTYHVLDGGDDYSSTSDGWTDELTLGGAVSGDIKGANLLHWERIYFDAVEVRIADGALQVGADDGDGLFLVNGAILDQSGIDLMLTGNLTNNGTLTTQDGVVGDVVTVAGNYAGTGLLRLDVNTATDMADMLNVAGDVTGGATTIVVNNLSPLVATGNDITVVTVGGTSSAGDFVLQGGFLTAGAFDYTLGQSGSNFVLAAAVNSTGAVYETAPFVLGAFNRLPTLEQRVGQRQWAGQSVARAEGQPLTGAWVRFTGDKLDATTTTGSSIASKTWGLQTGADFAVEPGDAGQWVLGVTGQYGKVSSTVTSALGFGTIDAEGFGVGATATWYGNTGTYVDLQGQVNWIDSDISSSAAGALVKGQSAKAYALSAEVGHRFALNETSALVPQAQLTWGRIDGGPFTDSAGNAVDLGSNGRTIGRLGLAYEYAPKTAAGGNPTKAYVIGNILHDFSGDSSVKVGGASLSTGAAEKTWGEIGVGGSYAFDANKTLYGEAAYRTSFGGSSNNNGLSATVGLRIQW